MRSNVSHAHMFHNLPAMVMLDGGVLLVSMVMSASCLLAGKYQDIWHYILSSAVGYACRITC